MLIEDRRFRVVVLFAIALGASCTGSEGDSRHVVVEPQFCGPLAGHEYYGVVFSGFLDGEYRRFAAKGRALEVCPLLTQQAELIGTIESRCITLGNEPSCREMMVFELSEEVSPQPQPAKKPEME